MEVNKRNLKEYDLKELRKFIRKAKTIFVNGLYRFHEEANHISKQEVFSPKQKAFFMWNAYRLSSLYAMHLEEFLSFYENEEEKNLNETIKQEINFKRSEYQKVQKIFEKVDLNEVWSK